MASGGFQGMPVSYVPSIQVVEPHILVWYCVTGQTIYVGATSNPEERRQNHHYHTPELGCRVMICAQVRSMRDFENMLLAEGRNNQLNTQKSSSVEPVPGYCYGFL